MKKMSRLHIVLIALLIVVVAVAFYFSSSYRGVAAKQPDLANQLDLAVKKLAIAKQETDPGPLKKQLDDLQATISQLSRNKPLFPEKPASVDIGNLIVDTVQKLNLTLLKLSPNDKAGTVTIKSTADAKGTKYSKAEYTVRVKGDLGRINSLIGEVEGANFATVTVEDVKIEFKTKEQENLVLEWWEGEFTAVTLYQYIEETKK